MSSRKHTARHASRLVASIICSLFEETEDGLQLPALLCSLPVQTPQSLMSS